MIKSLRELLFPLGVLIALFSIQTVVMLVMNEGEAIRLGPTYIEGMMTGFMVTASFLLALPVCMGLIGTRYGFALSDNSTQKGESARTLPFCAPDIGSSVAWLLSLAIFQATATFVFNYFEIEGSGFMLYAFSSIKIPALFILATVIAGPLMEECVFRGIMLQGLMRQLRPAYAVILTSIIWGAIHFQYTVGERVYIVALGMLLGYSRIRSGSLTAPLMLHALNNAMAIGLMYLSNQILQAA